MWDVRDDLNNDILSNNTHVILMVIETILRVLLLLFQDIPTHSENGKVTSVFSATDEDHMIITGCSTGSVRIYDTRITHQQW